MAQPISPKYRYIAYVGGVDSLLQEKVLSEVLNAWEPTCTYHIRATQGQVDLFLGERVDRISLADDLAAHGFQLTRLQYWNAAMDAMEDVPEPDPDAPPRYIHTGDRKADNAAYDRARVRWSARHSGQDPPTDQ
ncbi:MAG: hypothetical protein QM724_12555 [Flavobacteriales bacterium]